MGNLYSQIKVKVYFILTSGGNMEKFLLIWVGNDIKETRKEYKKTQANENGRINHWMKLRERLKESKSMELKDI